MIITKLEAENVKRLKAISITPDGSAVIIGGDNAQGKSSTLDSILMALGGKRSFDPQPVRQGEDAADIKIELSGDYLIHRKIKPDGKTELVVTHKDGEKYERPQELLNGLVSKVSFDPLEFERMQPAQQRNLLLQVLGKADAIEEVVARRKVVAEEKTAAGRDRRSLTEEIGRMPTFPEVTAKMEDTQIAATLEAAKAKEVEAIRLDDHIASMKQQGQGLMSQIASMKEAIARLEAQLKADAVTLQGLITQRAAMQAQDVSSLQQQIAAVNENNAKWAANEALARRRADLVAAEKKEARLDETIDAIEAEKNAILSSVVFPVPGLSFTDDGVLFNGVPFEQASQAERLKVSTAIGIALNPELKVLLIRDGSRLDEHNLKMVAEMAAAADAQVWIERVSKGAECSVIIEDGEIK